MRGKKVLKKKRKGKGNTNSGVTTLEFRSGGLCALTQIESKSFLSHTSARVHEVTWKSRGAEENDAI